MLAFHFPPIGGAGVQRPTKFVRRLKELGYHPTVLTGSGASVGRWTPHDASLAADVPAETPVIRVPGPEPVASSGWAGRSERWLRRRPAWDRWWVMGVIAAARGVRDVDVVYAVMPPWSTAEAAAAVAQERGVPWVADLGDPWALDDMMLYPTALHRSLELRRMRQLLGTASAIIMSTPEAVRRLLAAFPELASKTVVAIPNGYDARDFETKATPRTDDKFRIVHTGYLHTDLGRGQQRHSAIRNVLGGGIDGVDILTRSHVFLLRAVDLLLNSDPSLATVIEVHLAGVLSDSDREVAAGSPVVRLHGYLPHNASVQLIRSADLLFLPLHNVPRDSRAAIVPGKTYEYLAAQRPILAAVPPGDARDILAEAGNALICDPDDVEAIAEAIRSEIAKGARPHVPRGLLDRFEYGTLAMKLGDVFEKAAIPPWLQTRYPLHPLRHGEEPRQRARVLYLTYHFPPIGGAGVQRSLKFVRYLPKFGYEPVVITGPGEARDRWTPSDATLALEIPSEIRVLRVEGPEPPPGGGWRGRGERWMRMPSRWNRWWIRGAVETGEDEADVELIYATVAPAASAVAAAELARRLKKPWAVELRDPWALDEMMLYPTALHRKLERRRMRRTLQGAAAIVMNTPEAADRLLCAFPEFRKITVVAIPNGFDAADFEGPSPKRADGKFRIVHTGYLHTELGKQQHRTAAVRHLLGGTSGGVDILTRSHVYLLEAIARLLDEDASLSGTIELHLAGVLSAGDRAAAGQVPFVRLHGYLPHAESVQLLKSADLLFLPMQNLAGGRRATIVPGKTYEYLGARRPILAAVPPGDARDILQAAGNALLCRPDDVTGMVDALREAIARWRLGKTAASPPDGLLARFERTTLTSELAQLFDAIRSETRTSGAFRVQDPTRSTKAPRDAE